MTKTEDIAHKMRESVFESRPADFLSGLTPLRAVIGLGVGLMGLGIATLVLSTLTVIAAALTPFSPIYAGGAAMLLTAEGFGIVLLCSVILD